MLCSALSMIPSTTVPSKYNVKLCSVTSAPDTSQIWEQTSIRLSSTLSEEIPMLPIEISPRTSYVEEAWVVISPKLQSLENDDGSSDMCLAWNEPNPLKADILPYSLTHFSQNELRSNRSSSLPSLSIRHDSSPEYLLGLFINLVPALFLFLLRCRFGSIHPTNRNSWLFIRFNARILGIFHKISQIYEKVCSSLEPEVPAGKTRLRWKRVSRPVRFLFECVDGLELSC